MAEADGYAHGPTDRFAADPLVKRIGGRQAGRCITSPSEARAYRRIGRTGSKRAAGSHRCFASQRRLPQTPGQRERQRQHGIASRSGGRLRHPRAHLQAGARHGSG